VGAAGREGSALGDEEEYGIGVETPLPFEQAVSRTRLAMRSEGFSILSEMPVPPTLGDGTGRRHLFMGVWERLIAVDNLGGPGLDVGDHLPCNLVVFEEGGTTMVAGLDPLEGLEGWDAPAAATAARTALERVLEHVASPAF
jgi:uncharacterized protein (DUF302 family)